jgi:methylated-DNA-protein-cysteine methyltransferase related protein
MQSARAGAEADPRGAVNLYGHRAPEQRLRLEFEGVRFRGKRVDMEAHQFVFRGWEPE